MKKRELAPQAAENTVIAEENPLAATGVEKMILVIRDKQVLLDRDLATLYGVETRRINEQVKRNIARFPEDFCFQLNRDKIDFVKSQIATSRGEDNLKSQNATSSWGGRRKMPYAFTEQGVAMLSSVLKSESAIRVNIAIMRAFVQLRHYMMGNVGIVNRFVRVEGKEIEQDRRLLEHDRKIRRPRAVAKLALTLPRSSILARRATMPATRLRLSCSWTISKGTALCSRNC